MPEGNGKLQADAHVEEVVRSAERELCDLLQRRADLMKRIGTLKQTLAGLADLFGDSVLSEPLLAMLDRRSPRHAPGLTRACRNVLMESAKPLSTLEVDQELRKRFPGLLEHHKEPRASITTVLNRLVGYAEARSFVSERGRKMWQWTTEDGKEKRRETLLQVGTATMQ